MPLKSNYTKHLFSNLLTLFLSLFILLTSAEFLIKTVPWFYCLGYKPSQNDKIVYELYPGYRGKSLNATISPQGLRDRIFSIKKQPDVFRIAVVGDSMSFAWGLNSAESFPKVLEKILNAKGEGKFEVINFSVPGYNTAQELETIKEKVLRFSPDLVVLVFCGNDTYLSNFIQPQISLLNYLYNKSYLVRLSLRALDRIAMNSPFNKIWLSFKQNILGMFYYEQKIYPYPGLEEVVYNSNGNPPNSKNNVPLKYWYMLGYDNYRIHLANILEILKKNKIHFTSAGLFDDKEALRINQELGIINIYDFSDILAGRDDIFLTKDRHWNAKGHRLIAEYLYQFLTIRQLL